MSDKLFCELNEKKKWFLFISFLLVLNIICVAFVLSSGLPEVESGSDFDKLVDEAFEVDEARANRCAEIGFEGDEKRAYWCFKSLVDAKD